eukprot:6141327-Pleurochrysis_carterae.AAC.5
MAAGRPWRRRRQAQPGRPKHLQVPRNTEGTCSLWQCITHVCGSPLFRRLDGRSSAALREVIAAAAAVDASA